MARGWSERTKAEKAMLVGIAAGAVVGVYLAVDINGFFLRTLTIAACAAVGAGAGRLFADTLR